MIIPEKASYLEMPITKNIPINLISEKTWFDKMKKWRTEIPSEEVVEDFYQIIPSSCNKIFEIPSDIQVCCFIPKRFIFNGASVPRQLSSIYLPHGILYLGAFLHDFIYSYEGLIFFTEKMEKMQFHTCTQEEADFIFNEINEKVNDFKTGTYPAYKIVRTVGFIPWKNCRKTYDFIRDFPEYADLYIERN